MYLEYNATDVWDFNYDKLPVKLRKLRQLENYTQKYIAQRLNISRQSYTNYESGRVRPDINTLTALSDIYGIPFEYFFEDYPKNEHPFIVQIQRMASYSKEFTDFYEQKENMSRYNSLSRKEKELMFYFKKLNEDMQKELLIDIYLKYLLYCNNTFNKQ